MEKKRIYTSSSATNATTEYDDSHKDLVFIDSEEIETANLLLQGDDVFDCCACKPQSVIRLRSKGALLLLALTSLIDISYNGALGSILSALLTDVLHFHQTGVSAFLGIIIVRALPQLGYPIAGWLADVHFGRYKVIMSGLWLMLVGYVIIFITFLIKHFYDTHWGMYVAYLGVFPVAFLTINSGLAAFNANIIPFGLDQMPGASTEQLSAFVHWYYAARNILAGIIPLIPCFISGHEVVFIVHSAAELSCVLLTLLLGHGLKHWLIIELQQRENPFQSVYKVLRFASKHKAPRLRSSFTYWEEEIPKRIDLGKEKYGGPFSAESVEDVKTVIRITVLFLALFGYVISYHISTISTRLFEQTLSDPDLPHFNCNFGHLLAMEVDTVVVALGVIIFEFLIRPLFGNLVPSMRKRIGLGIVVGLIATMTVMILEIKGYQNIKPDNSSNDPQCYLVAINTTGAEVLDVNSSYLTIFYIFIAFSEMLVYISVLEFIVAQSPYGMRGLLVGTFYFFRGLFAFIGAVLILAFSLGYEYHPPSTKSLIRCGIPLYALTLVIGVSGFVCYVVIAKRYKNREREEHVNTQAIAEDYYGSIIKSRLTRKKKVINKKS